MDDAHRKTMARTLRKLKNAAKTDETDEYKSRTRKPESAETKKPAGKTVSALTVIGAQWGDEGKGKIVDILSAKADVIVRFQGGHNAGHTLVVDGNARKLSLLPSGIFRAGKLALIGNGVVLDPHALLAEIDVLAPVIDIAPENLRIADNCCLILPIHRMLDQLREHYSRARIGTTGLGIGPAYEDKVGRRSIRVCDLAYPDYLAERIENVLSHHRPSLQSFNVAIPRVRDVVEPLLSLAPRLLSHATRMWEELANCAEQGKNILFEGAQGMGLDIDHGSWPFVTSSNTVADYATIGGSWGGESQALGVIKAYTTRVGEGPFPTELKDNDKNDTGSILSTRGREYGTVTGRKRRCGWIDLVSLRQSARINRFKFIALTKLDVLDTLPQIKLCVGYKDGERLMQFFPSSPVEQARIRPVYKTMPGWRKPTQHARHWNDLPKEAGDYLQTIAGYLGVRIALVSVGPGRDETIVCNKTHFL